MAWAMIILWTHFNRIQKNCSSSIVVLVETECVSSPSPSLRLKERIVPIFFCFTLRNRTPHGRSSEYLLAFFSSCTCVFLLQIHILTETITTMDFLLFLFSLLSSLLFSFFLFYLIMMNIQDDRSEQ